LLSREGKLKNVEIEFQIKSKERRIEQISSELTMIGSSTFVLSIINDITEKYAKEIALRTSKTQLATALEIANLGPWEYDADNDVLLLTIIL
jgi:PAS domain-containing protein